MIDTRKLGIVVGIVGCLSLVTARNAAAANLDLTGLDVNATVCTAAGGTYIMSVDGCQVFGGAIWTLGEVQPAGSGVLDSFSRVHQDGQTPNPNGIESGMNTNGTFNQDEKPGNFTHDITSGQINTKVIGGVTYYELLLDINQTGEGPNISLTGLNLCTSATGSRTITANAELCGAGEFYNMNGIGNGAPTNGTGNSVSTPGVGSGIADLFVYIPVPAGVTPTTFIYLWSQFGASPFPQNDGYEEWKTQTPATTTTVTPTNTTIPTTAIPEPTTLALLGSGLLVAARGLRRRRNSKS